MITEFALLPSRRMIRWLDAVSILAGVVFLTLGLVLGSQLWNLAQLHRGLLDAAARLGVRGPSGAKPTPRPVEVVAMTRV